MVQISNFEDIANWLGPASDQGVNAAVVLGEIKRITYSALSFTHP